MATTMPANAATDVTLAAASAVETLTLPTGARWLLLFPPSGGQLVDVYVVLTSSGTAANAGLFVPLATINAGGWQYDIGGYGFVGLAGSAAGTVRAVVRT